MTSKEKRKLKKKKKKIEKTRLLGKNINRHHIVCKSRKGKDTVENIAYVDMFKHRKYHDLFSNKTPDEIINYLIDYFWNGQDKWVFEAIANRR